MISFIRGKIVDSSETSLILENGGIGYEIFMTGASMEKALRERDEVKIHTYFHIREDAMQLYGFLTKDDLQIFRLLLGVNGIGPKAALGILAALSADELRFAVLSDDVKTISRAPGIGKKTAQKLILELKDKLKLEDAFEAKLAHGEADTDAEVSSFDGSKEAVEALVALGYSSTEALRAVRKVTDVSPDDVEEFKEETGLDVAVDQLLYVCDMKHSGYTAIHVTFLLDREGGVLTLPDNAKDENPIHDVQFVPIGQLTAYGFSEKFVDLVRRGFPNKGSYMGDKENIGLGL